MNREREGMFLRNWGKKTPNQTKTPPIHQQLLSSPQNTRVRQDSCLDRAASDGVLLHFRRLSPVLHRRS